MLTNYYCVILFNALCVCSIMIEIYNFSKNYILRYSHSVCLFKIVFLMSIFVMFTVLWALVKQINYIKKNKIKLFFFHLHLILISIFMFAMLMFCSSYLCSILLLAVKHDVHITQQMMQFFFVLIEVDSVECGHH